MKLRLLTLFLSCSVLPLTSHADTAAISTCFTCHGENGKAPSAMWPNLAGQKVGYMVAQLKAFRDGSRTDPLMSPMAKNLTDQQIQATAEYYSAQPIVSSNSGTLNKKGQSVSGYCISCHGMQGETVNEEWPNLVGQNKDYLVKQLKALRDGSRHSPVMNVIAKDLTDEHINDVAEYYSQRPVGQ